MSHVETSVEITPFSTLMEKHDILCGAAHRVYFYDPQMALMWLDKAKTLQERAMNLPVGLVDVPEVNLN